MVVLLGRWKEGKEASVDVTIMHPLAPYISFHTVKDGIQAAAAAEEEKHMYNDAACAQTGYISEPFAATTFVSLGPETSAFMSEFGKLL